MIKRQITISFFLKIKAGCLPLKMALFEGSFERVCVQNFSAYLDKIGVSEAKKKIALNANLFRQIISFQEDQQTIKIVTEIQYGVDFGLTSTETW